jgi:hypothetical protein
VSCVLRAIGAEFDVEAFLRESSLAGATPFHRGEPRTGAHPAGDTRTASGFTLTVSDAPLDDLEAQVSGATDFLRVQEDELRRLGQFPGLQEMCLDFGIGRRDVAAQVSVFPAELLWQAGALDIDLVVTHYSIGDEGGTLQ